MTDTNPTQSSDPGAPTNDERNLAMLAHLLGIVSQWLGPLLIWLIKKDSSEFVNDQGKEALNFQITVFIAAIVCGLLTLVVVGCFLLPVVLIANIVFCIMGAMAAGKGQRYRYPFAVRLIK